ncbi:MAG: mannose-1-phosphate guanylyltransferase [Candidatus Kerfeldbacteria bacterium]|nr:mannose-1-phosphate guanylyltransferase [Candidatus Kerfeldbacteria bacterium]
MKFLILAGGSGTRLWPLSRQAKPKQVQPWLDASTMLQHTWRRLRYRFAARDIFVSTTAAHLAEVRRQLPQLKPRTIIVEPQSRNTAAAIGLACLVLARQHPNEVVVTVNSDHHVADSQAYCRTLNLGERIVRALPHRLLLLGVKPTYPETGYGYIKLGSILRRVGSSQVFAVERFTEKPSLARAKSYVRSWKYLWNSGLFMFYPQALLKLYRQYAPRLQRGLGRLDIRRSGSGEWRVGNKKFSCLPALSLDYAVVERARELAVLPAEFGWADVGHWRTVYDILANPKGSNVSKGRYVSIASGGNLVYSLAGKLVATVGVRDHVIIDTGDALLVCPRARTQDVKHLVTELKARGMKKYL